MQRDGRLLERILYLMHSKRIVDESTAARWIYVLVRFDEVGWRDVGAGHFIPIA